MFQTAHGASGEGLLVLFCNEPIQTTNTLSSSCHSNLNVEIQTQSDITKLLFPSSSKYDSIEIPIPRNFLFIQLFLIFSVSSQKEIWVEFHWTDYGAERRVKSIIFFMVGTYFRPLRSRGVDIDLWLAVLTPTPLWGRDVRVGAIRGDWNFDGYYLPL